MANRLADSVSLYLRQHADNPVNWYEWCDEALDLALAENKPIFLSIGYSSCHWCHVMAHESFEDDEVAEALNKDFISIKIDREERPDLDEVFITAVQLATGHAGWPLTIFLTPDRLPFFAGTYFPRQGRDQVPGFLTLVGNIASAWRESRDEIVKTSQEFAAGLNSVLARPMEGSASGVELVDRALDAMHSSFDYENGGYGTKPKFPPFSNLLFLLEYLEVRPTLPGHPDDIRRYCEEAEHIVRLTLSKMLAGSIYDWVAGGIHRYSTDERWHLPHFEKTLTDQAQLVRVIARAEKLGITGFSGQAAQTIYWVENMGGVKNSLWNEDGTIASAQDADSEGEEGAFSVWTLDEVAKLLGVEGAQLLGVVEEGNFFDEATGMLTGTNVIVPPGEGYEEERRKLRAAQLTRELPSVDSKAVTAANGMWLGALVEAGEMAKAGRLAKVWLSYCQDEMPHMVQDGKSVGSAFLDDLAHMVDGWLDLAAATDDSELREAATQIWDREIVRFADSNGHGFYYSAYDPMFPFNRTKPIMDSAVSGANAVALRVLRKLGRDQEVDAHLATFLGWAERVPTATETLLVEVLRWLERSPEPQLGQRRDEVVATLHPPAGVMDEDGWAYFELVLDVPQGMKIPSNEPAADWLLPTKLEVDGAYAEMAYPEGEEDHYTGEVRFPLRVKPLTDARRTFAVKVHYQLCNDSTCFAPTAASVSGQVIPLASEGNVN